jgi:glycosyltransferase involved in cell wall biosynthesis
VAPINPGALDAGVATRMKRLLAISWAMPPYNFPRAIQVSRTLKHLNSLGWQITVICADLPDSLGGLFKDHVLAGLYDSSYRIARIKLSGPQRRIGSLLQRFYRSRANDIESQWVERAVPAARQLLGRDAFSAIVSFAQPWTDHLIGLRLRDCTDVPWVAHFSDPWVDSPYYQSMDATTLREWADQERCVVEQADGLVFTTSRTAKLVMSKYSTKCRQKVHVVPHGYDETILKAISNTPRKKERFLIVHTGDFYPGKRTPSTLFAAMHQLKQQVSLAEALQVSFVGANFEPYVDEARRLGIEDSVSFAGRSSVMECTALARDADALLLIDAPSDDSVFLPSKLIDYMMFRKPILGLTPRTGASADLLRRLECPVVEPDDISGITSALAKLLSDWESGRLTVSRSFESVSQSYDIRQVAAEMSAILTGLEESVGVLAETDCDRTIP